MKVLLSPDDLLPLITRLLVERYPMHNPKGAVLVANPGFLGGPSAFHVECELEPKTPAELERQNQKGSSRP